MTIKWVTSGCCLVSLIAPIAVVAERDDPSKDPQAMVIQWFPKGGLCQDVSFTEDHLCLKKKAKVFWLIANDCAKAVFRFTLKHEQPVTNCKISPPQPTFLNIESPFGIAEGGNIVVECVVHEKAMEKKCNDASNYKYTIELIQGGGAGLHLSDTAKPIARSHELDIGVKP